MGKLKELPLSKRKQIGSNVMSVSEYKNMNETEDTLQNQCDEFLMFFPDVKVVRISDHVWRKVYSMRDSVLQIFLGACLGGLPDLLMIKKNSCYNSCLAVELKVKGRKLRQNQKRWADVVNVFKVERFEDFQEIFETWYRGERFKDEEEE